MVKDKWIGKRWTGRSLGDYIVYQERLRNTRSGLSKQIISLGWGRSKKTAWKRARKNYPQLFRRKKR